MFSTAKFRKHEVFCKSLDMVCSVQRNVCPRGLLSVRTPSSHTHSKHSDRALKLVPGTSGQTLKAHAHKLSTPKSSIYRPASNCTDTYMSTCLQDSHDTTSEEMQEIRIELMMVVRV